MDKPRWLEDSIEVQQLLHRFVDKLDSQPLSERKQDLRIPVNKKILPELFRHDEQSDQQWFFIKNLAEQYKLFRIKAMRKTGPYDAEFNNTVLVFNPEAEGMLRTWLSRPIQLPYAQQWRNAVRQHAAIFIDEGTELINRPAQIPGLTVEQVVNGFVQLAIYVDKGLSLRQLSAMCFHGHSKFLDARDDLLGKIFSGVNIQARPVLVNIFLPEKIGGVLFIENHDTYMSACNGAFPEMDNCAVVFVSGFQGGAKRIRESDGASLHYHSRSHFDERLTFERWWFESAELGVDLFFWGDFDYSGMSILKVLRQRFGNVRAWQSGYDEMLAQITSGCGHEAKSAGKEDQLDPGQTGCAYADEMLLPAMRSSGLFLDQEAVVVIRRPES